MGFSVYDASVPLFSAMLANLSSVLGKGEENAISRKIEPSVFLNARLAPDMLNLTKQVQIATDHARNSVSRLAGRALVSQPDVETDFAGLKTRIAAVQDHLAGFSRADLDAAAERQITLKIGGQDLNVPGADYLLRFATPNFYFHMTTAYAILRHNGVPLGKADFLQVRR